MNEMTKADRDAVKILRDAYLQTDMTGSDKLFNARQYLQDRKRYEKLYGPEGRFPRCCQ